PSHGRPLRERNHVMTTPNGAAESREPEEPNERLDDRFPPVVSFQKINGRLADNWPQPPSLEAYHGLAGEYVHAVEPHTEADPVAILGQLLAAVGNVIDRTAHFKVEADKHFC